jgi:CDP-diacylglycerol--glycerol-3-phosphate 3-phosphatidyltransferase
MSFPFNLPIALTLFRIVLVPLIIVFVISSDRVRVLIAAGIFVAASLTDWLDGFMARRRNQVTRFGTLLDPVADKLLVAAALVALVQVDMVRAWVAMIIIGRELAVTGLRGVALSMGVVVPASSFGKLKTVSQYVGITILILERGVPPQYVPFHLLSVAALWVMLGLTVLSGADYFYRFLLKAGPRAIIKDLERWP